MPSVSDLPLNADFAQVKWDATLSEVKSLLSKNFRHLVILDEQDRYFGFVPMSECRALMVHPGLEMKLTEVARPYKDFVLGHYMVREVLKLMSMRGVDALPVLVDDKVTGLVAAPTIALDLLERYDEVDDEKQSADRKKDYFKELVSFFAHDLKSPLSIASLSSDLLLDRKRGKLDSWQNLTVNRIRTATRRSLERVTTLLEFIRSMDSDWKVKKQETNLREFIANVVDEMRNLFDPQRRIKIYFVACPDVPIDIDPDMISRVLFNLLENAYKSSQQGQCILVECEYQDGKVVISVTDEGPGISDEMMESVFEPFFANQESRAIQEGYGLGLSIVKRFISLHDGELGVTNTDRGAQFYFTLPCRAARPIFTKRDAGEETRVLLVDDDSDFLEFYSEQLKNHGIGVDTANSGAEAIEKLNGDQQIDLVLADIRMPGMDGLELKSYQFKYRKDVPTMFLTGYFGELTGNQRYVIADAPQYWQKPADPKMVVDAIREQLG